MMQDFLEYLVGLVILMAVMWVFWIPTIEAYKRRHRLRNTIFLTNFFLGFTVLGWIICYIWSQTDDVDSLPPHRPH